MLCNVHVLPTRLHLHHMHHPPSLYSLIFIQTSTGRTCEHHHLDYVLQYFLLLFSKFRFLISRYRSHLTDFSDHVNKNLSCWVWQLWIVQVYTMKRPVCWNCSFSEYLIVFSPLTWWFHDMAAKICLKPWRKVSVGLVNWEWVWRFTQHQRNQLSCHMPSSCKTCLQLSIRLSARSKRSSVCGLCCQCTGHWQARQAWWRR